MDNTYLQHYGVLGMKWGVRRSRAQLSKGKTKRDNRSEDAKTASELKKKKVSEMSNAELRKLNERIQLEQNYSRLNPSAVKKGLKFAAAAAGTMGTVMNLYNNSDKMVALGRKVGGKIVDAAGSMVMKDLAKHL